MLLKKIIFCVGAICLLGGCISNKKHLLYPTMNLSVVGHTDNAPPARKSSVDNWNVSAQQAATIVRILTEEYDVSPSQVVLGAQGEYKPRSSNETDSGKSENRRVEFIMAPRSEDLVRAIRSVIQ